MRSQDDVYFKTAREVGRSEEMVRFVVKNFWNTLKDMMMNPLDTKKGILVTGFFKLFIPKSSIKRYIKNLKKNSASQKKIDFYYNLLNQMHNGDSQRQEQKERIS